MRVAIVGCLYLAAAVLITTGAAMLSRPVGLIVGGVCLATLTFVAFAEVGE